MSRGVYWWICLVTLVVSACGVAVGAVRWLGPDDLVLALAPLGRAPLFLGTIGAHGSYCLTQSMPGGRAPVWFRRPPNEGWTIVLSQAMLCATLAAFPVTPGGENEILFSGPFVLISALFAIDRMRRVQRQLAQPS